MQYQPLLIQIKILKLETVTGFYTNFIGFDSTISFSGRVDLFVRETMKRIYASESV